MSQGTGQSAAARDGAQRSTVPLWGLGTLTRHARMAQGDMTSPSESRAHKELNQSRLVKEENGVGRHMAVPTPNADYARWRSSGVVIWLYLSDPRNSGRAM